MSAERLSGGHVILCGLDRLGLRTLEELRRLGEGVVVLSRGAEEAFSTRARALGATLVEGSYRDESVWRQAEVADAHAAVLVEDDDLANLHAALAAREMNPGLRLVLRMFNLEFGRRVQTLLDDCAVLSASAIAAPAFVSAALHEDQQHRLEIGGRTLTVRQGPAGKPDVLLPLVSSSASGEPTLFPKTGDDVLSLVDAGPAPGRNDGTARGAARRRGRRFSGLPGLLATPAAAIGSIDRRLRLLAAVLLAVALVSSLVFHLFADLEPVDAIYFTVTIITTTGFGDINLREASAALKLYAVVLMLLGAATLAVFYAVIADAIVGARLARALGLLPRRLRGHTVVCGLGNVGYRIVEELAQASVQVAAAELHADARFLPAVRRSGVPVIVGDARLTETLAALRVSEARCLIAATSNDLANLETAVNARSLNPGLRVVVRLFDPDLAERVERAFGAYLSRSVSALAAPAFAAAALGQRVFATLPLGNRTLVVAQTRIEAGSQADGATVARLEQDAEARVLLLVSGDRVGWRPGSTSALAAGQELTVVATRRGLAELLGQTTSGHHPVQRQGD